MQVSPEKGHDGKADSNDGEENKSSRESSSATDASEQQGPPAINQSTSLPGDSVRPAKSSEIETVPEREKLDSRGELSPPTQHIHAATVPAREESSRMPVGDSEHEPAVESASRAEDNFEPAQQDPTPGAKTHAALAVIETPEKHSDKSGASAKNNVPPHTEDKVMPQLKGQPILTATGASGRGGDTSFVSPQKRSGAKPRSRKRKSRDSEEWVPESDIESEHESQPKSKKTTSSSKQQVNRTVSEAPQPTGLAKSMTKQSGPTNVAIIAEAPKAKRLVSHAAQPRGPIDVTTPKDAGWVADNMKKISNQLFQAVLSFCRASKVAENAASSFVPKASPELDRLYVAMFGAENWAMKLTHIEGRNDGVEICQIHTLLGLLGAGVTSMVFGAVLPWDLEAPLKAVLGKHLDTANKVFVEQYHDTFDGFMKRFKEQQLRGSDFKKEMGTTHAQKLTNELMLILRPHLLQLEKGAVVEIPEGHEDCEVFLHEAFEVAIMVKATLSSSSLGPFSMDRPRIGIPLNPSRQKPFFELGKEATTEVLFGVLPALLRKFDGKLVPWSRAVVIPYAAK